MKEVDYKSHLMRHYYQTGNMTEAKNIHKQLVGTKANPNPDELPKEHLSGDEDILD